MKKKYRVLKNYEFQKIIHKRKFIANDSFVIYYQKNQLKHIRIGISVSKKLGNAVKRNYIKRQIRMMCHNNVNKNISFDYIIITRPKYLMHNFSENEVLLNRLLERIMNDEK